MFDILVLGATGFTGRLIVQYLHNHRQRSSFTFAIGARSKSKGEALKKSLGIDDSVPVVHVDLTQYETIEEAVKQTKVVLNAVGPFWLSGDGVVRACATHGKRYVDLAGELHFVRRIIDRYDYLATKTKAIIVPSCGLDAMPADLAVFLSNRVLKNALGPDAQLGLSESYFKIAGTMSGGSFATLLSNFEETPPQKYEEAHRDYALSQVRGHPSPPAVLAKRVPFSPRPRYAGHWFMELTNRGIVQRTYGLNEFLLTCGHPTYGIEHVKEEIRPLSYGPQFRYAEYKVFGRSRIGAIMISAVIISALTLVAGFPPFRWLMKQFMPKPGEGPSEERLAKGFIAVTNYTACASSPGTWGKSVIHGQGDPGYTLSACMISEAALALVLDEASLPISTRIGGVLTPATALGAVLISRLEASGQLHFESEIIRGDEENRKDR